jgi:hypothetical protein
MSVNGGAPLLEVDDLRGWFQVTSGILLDRHVGDIKAVDGVTFSIARGETVGLVGESGCGKSTLGADDPSPLQADQRSHRLRGPGHHARLRERVAPRPAEDADGLPGSVCVAQPSALGRSDHRRAAAHARNRLGSGRRAPGWRAPHHRRAAV